MIVDESAHCVVRRIARDEINELLLMCAEHAGYERAEYDPSGKAAALERSICEHPVRLHVWVAELHDTLIGYAAATSEFSTWSAREFLHMDCLFVREGCRGARVGAALLAAVVSFARARGFAQIQWQTPDWNSEAARFYSREGASATTKLRFTLAIQA